MTNTNTDPQVVETQVIPQIIRQAQESLGAGTMNPEQFSDLMRQVQSYPFSWKLTRRLSSSK